MSFYSKYQLERLLADGPVKTFQAVESACERPVYLHLFNPEGRFLFDVLVARFRDSAGRLAPPLIETGEAAGSLYLVTEVLEPFENLRTWAGSVATRMASAPPQAPVDSRPVAGSSTKEPGEFTRMFALQQTGIPAEVVPQAPTLNSAIDDREPGAFTREFMRRAEAKPVVEPSRSVQPAWPTNSPLPEPAKVPPPLESEARKPLGVPMWPDSPPGHSGDISDLFGSALPGEHVDVEAEQVRAAQSAPLEQKPFRRAGTFTRMFGPGGPRKETPRERPHTVSFFSESGVDPFGSKATTPRDSNKESTKEDGPGEYTRMIAIPPQTGDASSPEPLQNATPAPTPHGSRALMIASIITGVLLIALMILAAILYSRR